MRIGFIGLGDQGAPMARRVVQAGFPTTLWARRPESLIPFDGLGTATAVSRRALGASVDVLCLCVVNDDDVDSVLRGDEGALADMPPGGIVLIHSTTHPSTCRRLQEDYPRLRFLDAPVSGGGERADEGTLLVIAGGDQNDLETVRPVLAAFAGTVVHMGSLGSAQEAKLLNNVLFAAHLGLAAEVYTAGRDRGLNLDALALVLREGSGRSYAVDLAAGLSYQVRPLGGPAGQLLAKDTGILAELLHPIGSRLIEAADHALSLMECPRPWRAERS